MTEKINEFTISFRGSSAISGELKRGIDYTFKVVAAINKAELEDNEDGTINVNYKAKLLLCETETEGKKVKLVARKNWTESQATRFCINQIHDEWGITLDQEDFYNLVQQTFRSHLNDIINRYIKL